MLRGMTVAVAAVLLLAGAGMTRAEGESSADPLSRGIALYQDRTKNVEAFVALEHAMNSPRTRTLARYYSARLNCRYGRFTAARTLLFAALKDSAGFDDAVGMLAWTNLKLGNTEGAITEWRRFVRTVGEIAPDETISERSIMLPDEYRNRLAELRSVPAPDSAGAVFPDTVKVAAPTGVGRPDVASPGADKAVSDLDRRLQSQIRNGYYGLGIAAVLIAVGFFLMARWARKRRKLIDTGPDFLGEVGRMFDISEERDEFAASDEELAELAMRRVLPARNAEPEPPGPMREPPDTGARIPVAAISIPEPEPVYAYPVDAEPLAVPEDASRRPVTEDVKALVTRLHTEGYGVVDIARLADLTRTEVDLIVAVRARNTESLIRTATASASESTAGAFHRAVAALVAEGRNDVEIARHLRVSTSEIALARVMIERLREKKA